MEVITNTDGNVLERRLIRRPALWYVPDKSLGILLGSVLAI